MSGHPKTTIQIWPITDARFAKDFANDLQDALKNLGIGRPDFGWTKNGANLRNGKSDDGHISIEVSRHKFRLTDARKKERFLNIYIPDGINVDDILEKIHEIATDIMTRGSRASQPDVKIAVRTPGGSLKVQQDMTLKAFDGR